MGAPKGNDGAKTYKAWFQQAMEKYTGFAPLVEPLEDSRASLEKSRMIQEKAMEKLAEQLPVWEWVKGVRGIGPLGLGQIVAECGDLNNYANPAKLWRMMGVGLFQKGDGTWSRQRKLKGADGETAKYSPRRRSVMFCLEDTMVRATGDYYELYLERKEQERTKPACLADIKDSEGKPKGKCKDPKGDYCKAGHIHNRARRYMGKRFLRDLWNAWRK